eukprot:7290446-Pyramimonas_sp.AAC.1
MATRRRHARSRRPGLALSYATSTHSPTVSSRGFGARGRDDFAPRFLKESAVLPDHVATRRGT